MMFPQHLQITDKRTCWHGNAGGKLNADPKNVVSNVLLLLVLGHWNFWNLKTLRNKFCICILKMECKLKWCRWTPASLQLMIIYCITSCTFFLNWSFGLWFTKILANIYPKGVGLSAGRVIYNIKADILIYLLTYFNMWHRFYTSHHLSFYTCYIFIQKYSVSTWLSH